MPKPYMSITGVTNPLFLSLNTSHSASVSTLNVECSSYSLNIGDFITADIGYDDNHKKVFSGFVKSTGKKVPDQTYTITAMDKMVRAVDFFIVSSNPSAPFTRENIKAEDLVEDLMNEASLTDFTFDATSFRFAVHNPLEVNLVSAYDYSKMVADLLTWHLYCDEDGTVHFDNRKPHVMVAGSPESDQPGFQADPVGHNNQIIGVDTILTLNHTKSEKDLRNRIVVYGTEGVYATASRATTIDPDTGGYVTVLPGGYYKSAALATWIIDDNNTAQDTADYNLKLMNRLSVELSMSVIGDPNLLARKVVHVHEPSLGVDGDYYIFTAEHNMGSDGYVTNMILRK